MEKDRERTQSAVFSHGVYECLGNISQNRPRVFQTLSHFAFIFLYWKEADFEVVMA